MRVSEVTLFRGNAGLHRTKARPGLSQADVSDRVMIIYFDGDDSFSHDVSPYVARRLTDIYPDLILSKL